MIELDRAQAKMMHLDGVDDAIGEKNNPMS